MAISNSFSIIEYKFDLVQVYPRTVPVVNLIIFLLLCFIGKDYIIHNPYTWFSLISAIAVFCLCIFYNWRSPSINILVVLLYTSILLLEYLWFGLPSAPFPIASGTISKGVLLDGVLGLLPYLYFGLRALVVLCILPVWWYSRKLNKE